MSICRVLDKIWIVMQSVSFLKSGLSPHSLPPKSVKIQSFTLASKLYAISYKL